MMKRLFDNYKKYSYNKIMDKEQVFEEFMKAFEDVDLEKIRKQDEEFDKKKKEDYQEIHLRYKMINLKELQKKYTREYLHESCM